MKLLLLLFPPLISACVPGGGGGLEPPAERPVGDYIEPGAVRFGDILIPHGHGHERRRRHCFHDSVPVWLSLSESVPIHSLTAGSQVLGFRDGKVTETNVTQLLYHAPDEERVFVTISTASGRIVRITPEHQLPLMACSGGLGEVLRASDVLPGDCLPALDGEGLRPDKVLEVSFATHKGVKELSTSSQNIVIDGVLLSTLDAGGEDSWDPPPLDPLYPHFTVLKSEL